MGHGRERGGGQNSDKLVFFDLSCIFLHQNSVEVRMCMVNI